MKRTRPKPRVKKLKRLTPIQIEQALQHVLTSTLAIYVLNNSAKPVSQAVKDLTEIQFNAAQLIGFIAKLQSSPMSRVDLNSALAGVFSFIPFHGSSEGRMAHRSNPEDDRP